jgi:hypothetical protein
MKSLNLIQKAHILGIDTLFDAMFDDPDFHKLAPIAPAIIFEMKEDFRAKFDVIVNELKHLQLKKSRERNEEHDLVYAALNEVKNASDAECKKKLEAFQHSKKEVTCT